MSRRKKAKVEYKEMEEKYSNLEEDNVSDTSEKPKSLTPDKKLNTATSSKAPKKDTNKREDYRKDDDKRRDQEPDSELDDPVVKELFSGLEGAAFQSRMPFDKMTSTEAACFPDVAEAAKKLDQIWKPLDLS
ncbi:hypothetical protein QE152_g39682 [Popillia japonica]|uniref:Uncharacterized protein n=1 Tax=Popillia japonica TaxID=7064 RepID=A0AAW1HTN7_POPJA